MFKFYAEGNVDFKTMLRIDIDSLNEQSLNALIDIDKTKISLNILYKILNEICITYAIES
jgi:predicted solute-binding protein